jgi:hypothetical protein
MKLKNPGDLDRSDKALLGCLAIFLGAPLVWWWAGILWKLAGAFREWIQK